MYKKYSLHSLTVPSYLFLLYVYFGIFLLLFKKRLKEYRKNYYITKTVENYSNIINNKLRDISKTEKEFYLSLKRYTQIKKIKKHINN